MRMMDKIKSMVLELCEGSDWEWKEHVEGVVKYSKLLAGKTGADAEVLELAAWLHDITKIKGAKKDHEVSGAEEAGKILAGLGYPPEKTDKIKRCILSHPSDKLPEPETKEEKILFAADALSHFDMFLVHARTCFVRKGMDVEAAREKLKEKYEKYWKKASIMPEAEELGREKYDAVVMILGES